MSNQQGRYSLRVDEGLMDWIKEQAELNHRTIIGQIKMMLEMSKKQIEDKE